MITRILDRGIEVPYFPAKSRETPESSRIASLDDLARRVSRMLLLAIGLSAALLTSRSVFQSGSEQLMAQRSDVWFAQQRH